jgi:hypothetical protein
MSALVLRRGPTLLFVMVALALQPSCIAESLAPDVGEVRAGLCKPEDSDLTRTVSWENELLPLIKRANGTGGCSCHLPTNRRTSGIDVGGLDMSTHEKLMKGGKTSTADTIVVPGDPCASVLLQKTSSAPPFGSRMPSDGPPYFTPFERTLLSDWIAEGAHDN